MALARRPVSDYVRGMAIADTDPDFDTLAYARLLREAGVPRLRGGRLRQAEAHAEAARTVRAGLATKADLDSLETRFDGRLDSLETRFSARLDTRLAALETRLTIRFFAGLFAVGGLIVAAVKLL